MKHFASNLVFMMCGGVVVLGCLMAVGSGTDERQFGAAIGMWLAATMFAAVGWLLRQQHDA
jgi:hypothetical protein